MSDLPRSQLDLLLLAALRAGPKHGYAVIEWLSSLSGAEFDLQEGTIYPALHRLEAQGLLASSWVEAAPRRRRVYEVTGAGVAALALKRRDWTRFVRAVDAVVGA